MSQPPLPPTPVFLVEKKKKKTSPKNILITAIAKLDRVVESRGRAALTPVAAARGSPLAILRHTQCVFLRLPPPRTRTRFASKWPWKRRLQASIIHTPFKTCHRLTRALDPPSQDC